MSQFTKYGSWLAAATLAVCICPALLCAQDNMQNSQTEMSKNSGGPHHMVTVTGCLKKGNESGGYFITGQDGNTYELTSKGVNLSEHVNHTVSVTGHVMPGSQEQEGKMEMNEKAESSGNQYSDLHVSKLKMVSESCTK